MKRILLTIRGRDGFIRKTCFPFVKRVRFETKRNGLKSTISESGRETLRDRRAGDQTAIFPIMRYWIVVITGSTWLNEPKDVGYVTGLIYTA
jgi:hypothetical protein